MVDTAEHDELTINGIKYVRADVVCSKPNGNRAIVIVDRGWIFAGDVLEENGRIKLSRAVWLFRWEALGFAAAIKDWKSAKVDIRKIDDIDIPANSEVFRVPVADDWGVK